MSTVILNKDDILCKLRNIKSDLGKNYGVTRIGIFGSVARNEANENSDVDIVVEMAEPKLFYLVHIKELLEKDFNKHVDVIRYRARMNAYLKARIDREAVYA